MRIRSNSTLIATALLLLPLFCGRAYGGRPLDSVFHYSTVEYADIYDIPEWVRVLKKQAAEDWSGESEYHAWQKFLNRTKTLSTREQIAAVNTFANKKKYILDINNYGIEDYWAIVIEFLRKNGDCEDFAITKFFSLKSLGFTSEQLRIVVLQDTNLGIAHAVLAVDFEGDVLILDNQVDEVISHERIIHYTPLFSVNESHWWLHLPPI